MVVGHGDDQGVLGDAELLELGHHLADEWVDVALQAILQNAPRCRAFLRVGDEARQIRPVGDVEGLARLGVPLDEFQGAPLRLGINLQIVLMAVVAPLAGLSAFLALGNLDPALGDKGVVELVGVRRQHVLEQADGSVGPLGDSGVE